MTQHQGRGQLVAIVGPSGAGKDSLIAALADARPDIVIARRIITRYADVGSEDHLAVSDAVFDTQLASGRYAFHWGAHGLRYAIPARIDADLSQGRTVIFNGSRRALPMIATVYPQMRVLMVTAPADILAQRLLARGRESKADIAKRLDRANLEAPEGADVIVNDGPLDKAVAQLLALLNHPEESA